MRMGGDGCKPPSARLRQTADSLGMARPDPRSQRLLPEGGRPHPELVGYLRIACPSSDSLSHSNARGCTKLNFLKDIHRQICRHLCSLVAGRDKWNGLNLKAVDGRSVQLMDTDENQEAYPQPSRQKEGCGLPAHGYRRPAQSWAWRLGTRRNLPTVPPRNHCRSSLGQTPRKERPASRRPRLRFLRTHLPHPCARAHVLMKLHQARAHALDWNHGKKISPHERLVTWRHPYRPAGSAMTRADWDVLPKTLEVRLIKPPMKIAPGKRGTDSRHHAHGSSEIRRHRTGRSLRTSLGHRAEIARSQNHPGHGVLRGEKPGHGSQDPVDEPDRLQPDSLPHAMRSGRSGRSPVWHMSFKGVLDLVCASHESFRAHAGEPRIKKEAMKKFIIT